MELKDLLKQQQLLNNFKVELKSKFSYFELIEILDILDKENTTDKETESVNVIHYGEFGDYYITYKIKDNELQKVIIKKDE